MEVKIEQNGKISITELGYNDAVSVLSALSILEAGAMEISKLNRQDGMKAIEDSFESIGNDNFKYLSVEVKNKIFDDEMENAVAICELADKLREIGIKVKIHNK